MIKLFLSILSEISNHFTNGNLVRVQKKNIRIIILLYQPYIFSVIVKQLRFLLWISIDHLLVSQLFSFEV